MLSLDKCKIENSNSIYYIPNFINENQEKFYLNKIYQTPKTKWVQLSNRRLQNWGGQPRPKGMIIEPMPLWMTTTCESISFPELFESKKPNHVLINEYSPGQGIMPHTDGPLYHPVVCTLSLGSHTVLVLNKDGETSEKQHILLERRSLVILTKDAYINHLHAIDERTHDLITPSFINKKLIGNKDIHSVLLQGNEMNLQRDNRVSITMRHVLKTVKFKLNI